jgi:hypothetical protein
MEHHTHTSHPDSPAWVQNTREIYGIGHGAYVYSDWPDTGCIDPSCIIATHQHDSRANEARKHKAL